MNFREAMSYAFEHEKLVRCDFWPDGKYVYVDKHGALKYDNGATVRAFAPRELNSQWSVCGEFLNIGCIYDI